MRLLADLRRALEAFRPDDAEELLREIELRLGAGEASRVPGLPRGRLLDEVAPAVREAWPDRGAELLLSLQHSLWPDGVIGPVSTFNPEQPRNAARIDDERDSYPSFVVTEASRCRGVRLLLHRDSMILGRARGGADFALVDNTVSKLHMRITLDAREQVFVEDLMSTSGIFVNGRHAHESWLNDGDRVRCGQVELRFIASSA